MSHHIAVSLLKVLLTAVIVGLLTGLLMSAAARVREQANAMQCQNNLKQLGLGIHNYHDVNEELPPLVDQGKGALLNKGLPSALALLMPYLQSDPRNYHLQRTPDDYHAHSSVLFDYRDKLGTSGTEFGGIANQCNRWLFSDPSDRTADKLRDVPMTLPDGTTGYYATGSYAANGMLTWGNRKKWGSITNGLANTVLFGERPQVCQSPAGDTIYNLWGIGFYSPHMPAFAALTPAESPEFWSTAQIAPALPLPNETAGDRDAQIRVRIGRQNAAAEPPDFGSPIQFIREGRPCDPRLPGTPHRNGMQVLMGDGSVRVFAPDTSPWVFWAACSPVGR